MILILMGAGIVMNLLIGESPFNFVGVARENPWLVYTVLALGLLVMTAFARQWQLTGRSKSS